MSRIGLTGTVLCAFLLSGCSWLGDWPDKSSSEKTSSVKVVQPEKQTTVSFKRKKLEMPPEMADSKTPPALPPLAAGTVETQTLSEAYGYSSPEIAPPSTRSMASAEDVEKRIERLEASVQQIHDAIENMQPALQRLAGLEVSLESLIGHIEPAAGGGQDYYVPAPVNNGAPVPLQRAPSMRGVPSAPSPVTPPITENDRIEPLPALTALNTAMPATTPSLVSSRKVAAASPVFVKNVRVGEHPGKTRLVLDVSNALTFDVAEDGRTLVVDMPEAGWQAGSIPAVSSPLIASVSSQPGGNGGSRLIVTLKKDVKVLWAENLKPTGTQGHRIVIDLAAA